MLTRVYNAGMSNTQNTPLFNEPTVPTSEIWIEGFIITRAEGRTDDKFWPVGRTMVSETLSFIDVRLKLAAQNITHLGYDKFDLVVVYSDGDQQRLRVDVDRNFLGIRAYYPSLYR